MMNGQRIGYVRVSSLDQNPDRQLENIPVDRTFTYKASGKDVARPQLDALLRFAREGDTVVVHSMDRLARNLDELRRQVQRRLNKGEAKNALARAVFFNRLGELRDRRFENQRYRASGLNLVVAVIVLWNTTYLER